MAKNRFTLPWARSSHLSDEDLIAYIDGELPSRRTRLASRHIRSCWWCRAQSEKFTRGITRFVECRTAEAKHNVPPARWAGFDARLSAAAAAPSPTPPAPWWRNFLPPFRFRLAAVTASAAAILLWTQLGSGPPLSATEVLQRAQSAETRHLQTGPQPLVYRRIRLSRRSPKGVRTTHVETWSDANRKSRNQPGGDEVWQDLQAVLRKNGLENARLLSALAYSEWRNSLHARRDEVKSGKLADGSNALSITTTSHDATPLDTIVEAGLVVRTSDWHPVEERLLVQGFSETREFQLAEIVHQVEPGPEPTPGTSAKLLPPERPSPIAVHPPTHFDPVPDDVSNQDQMELLATLALHRIDACLGEPIEIHRNDKGVLVQGLAETGERKAAIEAALQSVPALRFKIQTVEEVLRVTAAEQGQEATPAPTQEPVQLRPAASMTPERLQQRLNPRELAALSNRLVSLSSEWLAQAWALRHLEEAWPAVKVARLDRSSRLLLDSIVREHLLALGERIRLYRAILEPHMELASQPEPAVHLSQIAWREQIAQLLRQAQAAQAWTCTLFAGAPSPVDTPEAAVSQLASSLSQIEARLVGLQADVSGIAAREQEARRSSSDRVRGSQ